MGLGAVYMINNAEEKKIYRYGACILERKANKQAVTEWKQASCTEIDTMKKLQADDVLEAD